MKKQDLSGQRFGILLVLKRLEDGPNSQSIYLCQCECGLVKNIAGSSLLRAITKSCGCIAIAGLIKRSKKHGMFGSKTYRVWSAMKSRCESTNHKQYDRYGGRGIKVCTRWSGSFLNFLNDMGHKPFGKSIDRIDNDKNYCKSNCRWATAIQQNNNRGVYNRRLTFNSQTKTLSEWAKIAKLNTDTLWHRLNAGWTNAKAIQTPLKKKIIS